MLGDMPAEKHRGWRPKVKDMEEYRDSVAQDMSALYSRAHFRNSVFEACYASQQNHIILGCVRLCSSRCCDKPLVSLETGFCCDFLLTKFLDMTHNGDRV